MFGSYFLFFVLCLHLLSYNVIAEVTLVNVTVSSTKGAGVIMLKVHPDWAPLGAERFLSLVRDNFYDDARFFRVIKVCNFIFHKSITTSTRN